MAEAAFFQKCLLYSGNNALNELMKIVNGAKQTPYVRQIPLNDAVMKDSLRCQQYLIDDVRVETINRKTKGYFPLEVAVIWGKTASMVYLLSRGADPMLGTDSSVVDMGRRRQQRLQKASIESGDGAEFEGVVITRAQIEPLLKEGRVMLEVLEGVESCGSYAAFANANPRNDLVRRCPRDMGFAESRYQFLVLRSSVLAGRATRLPAEIRAAIAAEAAAKAAALAREDQTVKEALIEAGFAELKATDINDRFRYATLRELKNAKLDQAAIESKLDSFVFQNRMVTGDVRRFVRFVRELEEGVPVPAADVAASSKASSSSGAAKAAAKSKTAKPNPAAAALLAAAKAGAKAGAKGGYPDTKQSTAKVAQPKAAVGPDGIDLLFRAELPDNAFMLISQQLFSAPVKYQFS